MKYLLPIISILLLITSCKTNAQEGFSSWKEYGLNGKVKTMKVTYSNSFNQEVNTHRYYYFSKSGALDSMVHQSTPEYGTFHVTYYHTNGKTDSAIAVDKQRNILTRIYHQWINDTTYIETVFEIKDSTKIISHLTLNKQYRDWNRENKTYKNGNIILWEKYENTLSADNRIVSTITQDLLNGTNDKKCMVYTTYDQFNNPTDTKIHLGCDDEKYWTRLQKEYQYYDTEKQ